MKLINDFFYTANGQELTANSQQLTANSQKPTDFSCQVTLNADHRLYSVHFPGNPITPGACLVQMANEILNGHFGRTFLLTKANSIKFKKTVSPHDRLTFVFTKMVFEDDHLSTSLSIENGEVQFARMSLQFKNS